MKITLLEPLGIPAEVLEGYASRLRAQGHQFIAYDTRETDPEVLRQRTDDADVAILANTPYPASIVEAAPNLKLLNVAFTGVDHVALDACRKKGVLVCNAAGYSTVCVAEEVIGMTLACLRKFPECGTAVRNGKTSAGLRGREICGKTVGIIGTGAIGLQTAALFQAFGARVLAYSRSHRAKAQEMGIEYVSLETLMAQSDIVSVHVPSNGETKGMISRELLSKMKPTAIFINAARGAVVDNAALADALNTGKIAAAGVDVFDMEPPIPEDYPLLHAKNAVLAPHIGFLTEESMLRRAEIVFANVDAFLRGTPENLV